MISNGVPGKSRRKLKSIFLLILLAIITFICTYVFLYINRPVIYKGVKVNGVEVGGMTPVELQNFLRKTYAGEDKDITIDVMDKQYVIAFSDIYRYDFKNAVGRAYTFGREGNVILRLKDIADVGSGRQFVNIEVKPTMDEKRAAGLLEKIAADVDKPAVNAGIVFGSNGAIKVIPHQVGYKLDTDSALNVLKSSPDDVNAVLPVEEVEPKITSRMLAPIKGIVSQYSTAFNSADANRTLNLKTAANAINGYILMPGEVFSLNKVLGPRVKENGYFEAPVIVNGKMVPDYGGGVCQIATTVFNAAVRANLDITERYHHSFPVSYVPVGQDATISGDVLDFKFKNTSENPIYIRAYIKGNKFHVDIYGDSSVNNCTIRLSTEVLNVVEPVTEYEEDKTLQPGTQIVERASHKGYKVNVYKLIYNKENKLIKKELLHKDTYKPVNQIIKRNSNMVTSVKTTE